MKTFVYDAIMNVELLCKIAPVLMKVRDAILDGEEHVCPEIYANAVKEVKQELDKHKK